MPTVMILGAGGMAGHMIGQFLVEKGFKVFGYALRTNKLLPFLNSLDVLDISELNKTIDALAPDAIVNCVGLLNQFADLHNDRAVFLNSYLPHWLAKKTNGSSTKIIHLSTDCVFSGKTGLYKVDDFCDGDTFYDRSKALGEIRNSKDLTLRQSIIGPDLNPNGIGLLNWFLLQKGDIKGYRNSHWNGITTLQLAKGIEASILQDHFGLIHYVSKKIVSKCELLNMFDSIFPNGRVKIEPFDNHPRTNKSLSFAEGHNLPEVPSYETMLNELKSWMISHPTLYKHYL